MTAHGLLSVLLALSCTACVPRFAYVVNSGDGTVSVYAIDAAGGELRPLGYALAGREPRGIAFSSDSRFAFVANAGGAGIAGSVSAYTVDAKTGALPRIDANATAPGHQDYAATGSPRGILVVRQFVYVASAGFAPGALGLVSVYGFDSATGTLTPVAGSPYLAGIEPLGLAATGRFLYVLNGGGSSLLGRRPGISAYAIDSAGGALTRLDANPATPVIDDYVTVTGPLSIAVGENAETIYVVNGAANSIAAYDVNTSTGALSRVDADAATAGVQDFSTGANPASLVVSSGYAYGANGTRMGTSVGGVSSHRIGPGATLTRLDANLATPVIDDVPAGTSPSAVAVALETGICGFFGVCSRNTFVYAANEGSHDISAFVVSNNVAPGALTPVAAMPQIIGRRNPVSIATTSGRDPVTVTSRRAFVAHAGLSAEGIVWSYDVDPVTGALTPISTAHTGPEGVFAGRPQSLTVTPNGRFVYAKRLLRDGVLGYAVDPASGVLSVIPGSPFLDGLGGSGTPPFVAYVAVEPSGRFIYVSNRDGLHVLAIDPSNGALTLLPGAVPACYTHFAIHPSGRFLYCDIDTEDLEAFSIDPATGALTASPQVPGPFANTDPEKPPSPEGIALDPSGRRAYVADYYEGVWAFEIDSDQGALRPIDADGSTPVFDAFPARIGSGSVSSIFVEPLGRFAYAWSSGYISALRIDAATGALSRIDADPATPAVDGFAAPGTGWITFDAHGRFLYLSASGQILGYRIDALSGALSGIDTDPSRAGVQGFPSSFNPTGIVLWSEVR